MSKPKDITYVTNDIIYVTLFSAAKMM